MAIAFSTGGGRDLATAVGFSKQKPQSVSSNLPATVTETVLTPAPKVLVTKNSSTKSSTVTKAATAPSTQAYATGYDPIKAMAQPGTAHSIYH